jgi:single-strand DNA-binding protein
MAKSRNKVLLLGNIASDLELKTFDDGSVCNFTVATSESWKDRNTGQPIEQTDYHRCVARNSTAQYVSQYLGKGFRVDIEGKNRTRKWTDNDGKDHYVTEVIVSEVINLGAPKSQSSSVNKGSQATPSSNSNQSSNTGNLSGQLAS